MFSLLLFGYYRLRSLRQKKDFSQLLQDTALAAELTGGEQMKIPVPAAIVNLATGEIMWCNEQLQQLSGEEKDLFETPLSQVFPDMPTDWVLEGKTECPEEVSKDGSRYRVYGDLIQPEDEEDLGFLAAMLYWVDLTELMNIQDEYHLSRPVVGIILVDNYDELTSNLPDKSISGLSARLDDAITGWNANSEGILRKL